jgi:hypothetical protein
LDLTPQDLKVLKDLAKETFSYDEKRLDLALRNGSLREVFCKERVPESRG